MKIRQALLITSFSVLSAASGLALAETGSAATQSQDRSVGAAMSDTGITAKVKAKYAGDQRLKDSDIKVDTVNGTVTLSGTAKTEDAKKAAEELAKQVDGVASVDNQITTSSTAGTAENRAKGAAEKSERVVSDSWISTKVKSSLLADHTTKGLNIAVKTTNGTVNLSGTVSSQAELDRAVQIAKNIKGVKDVNSTSLKVAPSNQ